MAIAKFTLSILCILLAMHFRSARSAYVCAVYDSFSEEAFERLDNCLERAR